MTTKATLDPGLDFAPKEKSIFFSKGNQVVLYPYELPDCGSYAVCISLVQNI